MASFLTVDEFGVVHIDFDLALAEAVKRFGRPADKFAVLVAICGTLLWEMPDRRFSVLTNEPIPIHLWKLAMNMARKQGPVQLRPKG
jgi:hypothetical protein